jgi:hypothetical protein
MQARTVAFPSFREEIWLRGLFREEGGRNVLAPLIPQRFEDEDDLVAATSRCVPRVIPLRTTLRRLPCALRLTAPNH